MPISPSRTGTTTEPGTNAAMRAFEGAAAHLGHIAERDEHALGFLRQGRNAGGERGGEPLRVVRVVDAPHVETGQRRRDSRRFVPRHDEDVADTR